MAAGSVAGGMLDAIHRAEADARLTTGQLSGITTAISFGFFFFRVILAGASGMISVDLPFWDRMPRISALLMN